MNALQSLSNITLQQFHDLLTRYYNFLWAQAEFHLFVERKGTCLILHRQYTA